MSEAAESQAALFSKGADALRAAILFGGILNGYAAPCLTWWLTGEGETPFPISVLDILVIVIAFRLMGIDRTAPRFGKPGIVEAVAAIGVLAPSSAVSLGAVFFYGLACAWRSNAEARLSYLLLAGLAAVNLWETTAIRWFSASLGGFDAALTGALLSMFKEHVFRMGNVVGTEEHSIILFHGCTTLFILPKLVLVQAAAMLELGKGDYLGYALIGAALASAANLVRLTAMGFSAGAYATMHSSAGLALFDVVLMAIVLVVALRAGGRQCAVD